MSYEEPSMDVVATDQADVVTTSTYGIDDPTI